MGVDVAGFVFSIIQNFVYEIMNSKLYRFLDKYKYKRFIKSLKEKIEAFCDRNECVYLNSGAFQYFLTSSGVIQKTIERAISVNKTRSKDFYNQILKEARNIAKEEEVAFSHSEEMIIKDLCRLIYDEVSNYYNTNLTDGQRRAVSMLASEIMELRNDAKNYSNESKEAHSKILDTLKDMRILGDSKAEAIVSILAKMAWQGCFDDIETWLPVIQGKSDDLENAVKVFNYVFKGNVNGDLVSIVKTINSTVVRDIVIKNIIPMLCYKKENISAYEMQVSSVTLKDIILELSNDNYELLFGEKVENCSGMELHSFEFNKKYVFEEEWLMRQLLVIRLSELNISNTCETIEKTITGNSNLLTDLLLADKKIDELGVKNYNGDNTVAICDTIKLLTEKQNLYSGLCQNIKVLFYSILFKADMYTEWEFAFSDGAPKDVCIEEPIVGCLIQKRIDENDITLKEVQDYCNKSKKPWLLGNYFIAENNPDKLIPFCTENESILSLDIRMFFMFISALRLKEETDKIKHYLEAYKDKYNSYYEYWNEVFKFSKGKMLPSEFIDKCREGEIKVLNVESDYKRIENLILVKEYDIASQYVEKLELCNRDKFLIKRYKAAITLGKGETVEALNIFKEAYEINSKDPYVVENILSLSVRHDRVVEQKYIDTAMEIGTSGMYMLVAYIYNAQGDVINAKRVNRKSLLVSEDISNPAYGQYFNIETSIKDKGERKISVVEVDTAVYLSSKSGMNKWLCIHEEKLLPRCPYIWNGDLHLYIEEAAEMGVIRSKVGDNIVIDEEDYTINKIIPLDAYFFRVCMDKLEASGHAKTISITEKDNKLDTSELTTWLKENSKDEKDSYDWRKNYSSFEEIALPLFMYKRFTNANYLMFVFAMYNDNSIFIREISTKPLKSKRYILSFASLVLLYKLGVPVGLINDSETYITESTMTRVKTDATQIINRFDRDLVSSIGVYEGKLFRSEVEEREKDILIQNAGKISKYVEQLNTIDNTHDLKLDSLNQIDLKEMMGICDYDAICIVQNAEDVVLVSTESFPVALHKSGLASYNVTNLIDWLIQINLDVIELIGYAKIMLSFGCLYTINDNLIKKICEAVRAGNEEEQIKIYEKWDELFSVYYDMEDDVKKIALQILGQTFANMDRDKLSDFWIFRIAAYHILELNKLKVEINIDENGYLETIVYQVNDNGDRIIINK